MMIDTLQGVQLGGMTQWIRVRGTDRSNPVLLLMQQGPGLPIINEARIFARLLGLETDFTVVYWDLRGTGLSAPPLSKSANRFEISAEVMVDDTVSMLGLLHRRFGGKTLVAGFSFGATFAAQAAVRRPDLVAALVATAMDIDVPAAENHTYDFVLRTAHEHGNRRAIRQLEKIGPPPHQDVKQFSTRARWAMNFGGVTVGKNYAGITRTLLGSLVRSGDYSIADIARTLRGITSTQAALLPELATTDLVSTIPSLDVPIAIAQGRLDQVAPGAVSQRFYDSLKAPSKQLVWFENSAHTPQFDEPGNFRRLLLDVKATHLAAA
jgi:pimeloyl-ACP methyl ester carboxylesterase